MNEQAPIKALTKTGQDLPLKTIEKLKDIGILKDYKPSTSNDGKRFYIPDLYLLV
jgi:hypothetical protein